MNFQQAFFDEMVKIAGIRRVGRMMQSAARAEAAGRPINPGIVTALPGAFEKVERSVNKRPNLLIDTSFNAARTGGRERGFAPILHPQHYFVGNLMNTL